MINRGAVMLHGIALAMCFHIGAWDFVQRRGRVQEGSAHSPSAVKDSLVGLTLQSTDLI